MLSLSFLGSLSCLCVLTQCASVLRPQNQFPSFDGEHASPLQLNDMVNALDALQIEYWDDFRGTWPDAIDWTAAVLGTHLPASLKTISRTNPLPLGLQDQRENLIDSYFDDLNNFYYGQAWFSILFQAYDDMLWVVLGWLEAVTFVHEHAARWHGNDTRPWFGSTHIEAYAFRSRYFWEAAEKGWDEELCGGGMTWNPRLTPYKNTITNQLWIAASASMYLHYPGDSQDTALLVSLRSATPAGEEPKHKPHEEKYLRAAVKGYDWLMASNMTNKQGLFVDGYHIAGWRDDKHQGTKKCDVRDETVYTYNQGVLLTGQRGLWQATGNDTYLQHGHQLIRSVIAATGWNLASSTASEHLEWQGLGRLGVLEDHCDFNGDCSADSQTFKGIYFLHFNAFCQPLPVKGDGAFGYKASEKLAKAHAFGCSQYASWVAHNAKAAAQTRDEKGLFGMWWTEKLWPSTEVSDTDAIQPPVEGADVRNLGVPDNDLWRIEPDADDEVGMMDDKPDDETASETHGRRTAEIQGGGISVLRAVIEQST